MWINAVLLNQFIMLFALAAIYLWFAGFLGSLLYHFRKRLNWWLQVLMFGLTALIFVGIAWLPWWHSKLMHIQLGIVFVVVLLFSIRPLRRPEWIWTTSNAFRYLSLTLVLVVLWSMSGILTQPKLIIAPLAALAALLSWRRSHVHPEESASSSLPVESVPAGAPQGSREV